MNIINMIIVVKSGRICRTIRIWSQDMKNEQQYCMCSKDPIMLWINVWYVSRKRFIFRRGRTNDCQVKIITWLSKNPWLGEEQEKKYVGNTFVIYFKWFLVFSVCLCRIFSFSLFCGLCYQLQIIIIYRVGSSSVRLY